MITDCSIVLSPEATEAYNPSVTRLQIQYISMLMSNKFKMNNFIGGYFEVYQFLKFHMLL